MTYVIVDICQQHKNTSCVDVCPVDCIHPTTEDEAFESADQLYIDPTECIDCGACEEVCPVDAIFADRDVPPNLNAYIEINAAYFSERD